MDKKNNNLISLNYGKLGFTADFSIFEKLFNKMIHPKIAWHEWRTSGVFLKTLADCRKKVIKGTANYDEWRLASMTEADLKKDFNKFKIYLRVITKNKKINDESFEQIEQKNPDFLDNFWDTAQNYSSDYMQELWAKMLSGELENPNTYSVAVIEKIKSMSIEQMQAFNTMIQSTGFCPIEKMRKIQNSVKSFIDNGKIVFIDMANTANIDSIVSFGIDSLTGQNKDSYDLLGLNIIEYKQLKSLGLFEDSLQLRANSKKCFDCFGYFGIIYNEDKNIEIITLHPIGVSLANLVEIDESKISKIYKDELQKYCNENNMTLFYTDFEL